MLFSQRGPWLGREVAWLCWQSLEEDPVLLISSRLVVNQVDPVASQSLKHVPHAVLGQHDFALALLMKC